MKGKMRAGWMLCEPIADHCLSVDRLLIYLETQISPTTMEQEENVSSFRLGLSIEKIFRDGN